MLFVTEILRTYLTKATICFRSNEAFANSNRFEIRTFFALCRDRERLDQQMTKAKGQPALAA